MRKKQKRPGQKSWDFELTKQNKIPITKLDAARRQLETAIALWFNDGEPVSIHTLVMAAHEILRVLNRVQSGPPMMGEPCPQIRDEYTDVWRDLVLASSRFFKHSSRDPGETHFFPPRMNEAVMLDATECYHRLANDIRPLFRLFKWYMRVHMPKVFSDSLPDPGYFKSMTKQQFFGELISFATSPELTATELDRLKDLLGNSL